MNSEQRIGNRYGTLPSSFYAWPISFFVLLVFLTSILVGFTTAGSWTRFASIPVAAYLTCIILQTVAEYMRSP